MIATFRRGSVPTETTETKPAKSDANPPATDTKGDPEKPLPFSGITLNRVTSFQNGELKSYGFLSPEAFKLRADYDFINGNTLGAYSNFKFMPSGLNLQDYGVNGAFNFAERSRATGSIDVNRPEQTIIGKLGVVNKEDIYSLDAKVNSETGALTNATANAAVKFSNTVKADGSLIFDGIGQTLTGQTKVTEKENIYNLGGQLNTSNGEFNRLNADAAIKFSNTVKADGSLVFDGLGQTLTGQTKVTEKENIYNLNGQFNTATGALNYLNGDAFVNFGNNIKGTGSLAFDGVEQTLTGKATITKKENSYNFESQIDTVTGAINQTSVGGAVQFSDTVKGSGGIVLDGVGKTLTGNASVTEKENIYNLGGQLNTANGEINKLNADATVKFSDTVKGTGSLIYDGIGKTFTGNVSVNEKDNIYTLGGQINTATGGIKNFNLDTALKFSDSLKGTGSVAYDGIGQTLTGKASLTDRQNVYNLGGQINTATGDVNYLNADATVMFSGTVKGTGSLAYDGIGKSLTAAVGVTDRQNSYNLSTQFNTATGSFNNIAADANIGFAKGAGSFSLAAKASSQLAELGAGVNYTSNNLNYSGQVKLNNESGAFRFAEASAKISTMSERNGNFSFEAGYRPNDAFVKVGYTINFGGGGGGSSKRSAPSEGFNPALMDRRMDAEVSSFRDKQAIALLNPPDKKLYDQGLVGVQKLNASGAGLPVEQTALALTVLAKEKGLQSIGDVSIGKTTQGVQNIIIGNGPLSNPATEKAVIGKDTAANSPISQSANALMVQNALPQQATQNAGPTQDGTEPVRR
jgi:hypothetical protein